jgi:TonB-dependent SusC/RagA subfamily outer membrane receptor
VAQLVKTDLPTDYGNGASEINQENIESVNVLKAAASALYGSRAANGLS